MVEQLKKWWKDQSNILTTAIVALVAIIGVFLSGFWMDIADMKRNMGENSREIAALRENIPKDYTSLVTYLQDKTIIRVHDEEAQKSLQSIQTALAVSNQKMDALTETMKDYRKEYREDNPYVNEHSPGFKERKQSIRQNRGSRK